MAPRNKQDQLNRAYRRADVGRVGSSLRNQGFSQNRSGDTFYTVGGVKYNAVTGRPVSNQPAAKPRQQPAAQPPAPRQQPSRAGGGGGGSSRTSTPTTSSGGGGGKASPASETYRDGGKGLYQGTKEYRDKVGGSGNPLLNRFRQDMGRDTATGNKSDIRTTRAGTDIGGAGSGGNYSTPADKSKYVAPNGQLYQGPGYGSGQVPYKKPADDKPKVETKPQRRMSAGDQRYMNEWEKRRRGQSNVIG